MFELLKKKLGAFTSKVKENIEAGGTEKRELKARVSAGKKVKGLITGQIEISEKDVKDLLWELELSLLEADVEQETAKEICGNISGSIVGKKVGRKELDSFLGNEIKKILQEIMQTDYIDLIEAIERKAKKPFVILFLGPNGAGKTTSIAKVTHMLQGKGKKVILAAADTFRAASIEQLEIHAQRLGVRVVKHKYGADPAAVAYDAVQAAAARGVDVVLIDSAGRQETNKNLMRELEKICRVAKPDLKIFIGEALAGQAMLRQASEFEKELGIDGFILTKIDTDAKGGTTISLLYRLHKPVMFVGTGQEYKDLLEFSPAYIIDRIV